MTDVATAEPQPSGDPWPGAREFPWLGTSLAGTGGLLVTFGVAVLGAEWGTTGDDYQRWPGILLATATLVAATVLARRLVGTARSAATSCIAATVPVLAAFVVFDTNSFGYDEFRLVELLAIVGWLAYTFLGPARSRALWLGLALLTVWVFALGEAAGGDAGFGGPYLSGPIVVGPTFDSGAYESSDPDVFDTDLDGDGIDDVDDPDTDGDGIDDFSDPTPFGDSFGIDESDEEFGDSEFGDSEYAEPPDRRLAIALVSGAIGIAYLLALRRCDRRGRRALGTAFAVTAAHALVTGLIAWGAFLESEGAAGFFAVVAGIFIAWAGAGSRRFTTWFGVATASFGALLIAGDSTVGSATADSGSTIQFGLLTIAFGVGLAALAVVLARALREPGATRPATAEADADTDDGDTDTAPA